MPCLCGANSKYSCGCSEDSMCAWEDEPKQENKLLKALEEIEKCCDNQNPTHETIWRIAYNAVKEHKKGKK